jgi:hypothetical protein
MRIGNLKIVVVAGLALFLAATIFAQSPQDVASLTDVQIVELSNRAYARCDSYRDSGVVVTSSFAEENLQWKVEKPFVTAFVRPDRFRFELQDKSLGDPPPTSIIWAAEGEVRTWSDLELGVEMRADLAEVLLATTGASQGVSYRVPSLLLPEVARTGRHPLELNYAMRIADADDAGIGCFRIQGQSIRTPRTLGEGEQAVVLQENSMTIWIDRQSYLVRRVEETNVYDTFRTETVTTYNPEVNIQIPSTELDFGAPQTN